MWSRRGRTRRSTHPVELVDHVEQVAALVEVHRDEIREVVAQPHALAHAGEQRAAPWYHLVYDRITAETPYAFSRPAQLTTPSALPASCAENRGPADAPLFLVNHWVTTDPVPKPSDADIVNARGALLARVRECTRLRHHLANLVAVNFYDRGDLFDVVDELNRVR